MAQPTIAYCGAPPSPETLWVRWNLDPILITVLAVCLGLYLAGLSRGPAGGDDQELRPWRPWAFVVGWFTLSMALVSPICPLSVSLFSARVGQHMVLSLLAAPLIVLGRPGPVMSRLWPHFAVWRRGLSFATRPAVACPAFTLAIWFWHAPGPYAATFASDLVYWTMHITIIGSALMVWSALFDTGRQGTVATLGVGAISTFQMTLLGALITLTPRLLYTPHALTPYAWGLTQASDQQLGGLIMWVPGCSVFLAATLYSLATIMSERPRPAALA